jgi:hypothetical protein
MIQEGKQLVHSVWLGPHSIYKLREMWENVLNICWENWANVLSNLIVTPLGIWVEFKIRERDYPGLMEIVIDFLFGFQNVNKLP